MNISIRPATKADVPDVVRIYMQELPGFLRELGEDFLRTFYDASLDIPEMFLFVSRYDTRVTGFASSAISVKNLNKAIISRRPIKFISLLMNFFMMHPNKMIKTVQSFLYPGFSHENAELLTIAVDHRYQAKGAGRKLFEETVREFRKRGISEFLISAYDRLPANGFYRKIGCDPVSSFEFLGEKMNYYRYRISE